MKSSNKSNSKSDIGNIYSFLYEIQKSNDHSYSYLSGKWNDYKQWQVMAKAKVFELMNYFPREVPLNSRIIQCIDRGTHRQEEIEFDTAPNVSVRATILIPNMDKRSYPTVVALHDHGGFYYFGRKKIVEVDDEQLLLKEFKRKSYGGMSWASELVKRGYITFIIDAFYFGSRRLRLEDVSEEAFSWIVPDNLRDLSSNSEEYIETYNKICWHFEHLVFRHILISGTTWPGILFHDDRRAIDYLYTRPEVDKSRIACCGLSVGGARSALLSALDSRIKCGIVVGWMATLSSLLLNRIKCHTFMLYIPNLTRYMDLPDVMSIFAPKPLLVQQCSRDTLYTLEAMNKACETISSVYKKIGHEKCFEYRFYDNGHEFNAIMQEEAFTFLDRWLKAV